MNYKRACEILNIQSDKLNLATLKRQYRVNALLYHPDKNHSADANSKFLEVQDAYQYLLKYDDYSDDDIECSEPAQQNETVGPDNYKGLLSSFIKNLVVGEANSQLFSIILNRISSVCEATALDTLNKLDKHTLIKIYEIIKKYRQSMHFGEGFIQKIGTIITNRTYADECIILNPTLDDLMKNNLYKLTVNKQTYIVPLWHNELVYDNSGNDIYIKCHPMLPDNIEIDDANNIKMNVSYKIADIWGVETLYINFGTHCIIPVVTGQLKFASNQTIIYANMGISRINVKDVYDITKKSDLHLNITLEL
jgi:hypothetical protein